MPEGIRVNALAPRTKGVHSDDNRPVPAKHGGTRDLNRVVLVGETLRVALDAPATVAPGWLRQSARGTGTAAMPRG